MLTKRVATVLIPRFAIALSCRADPTWLLEAVALVEDDSATAMILEINGKAAKAGVAVGITFAQGEMLCPGLTRVLHDCQYEEESAVKVCELLQQIVPTIKRVGPGCFVTEAEGFEHLYGGESQLAQRLIDAIKTYGLPVQIGVADNQFAARVAAEISRGYACTIVPSGQAQSFLQPLPIKHLPLSDEFRNQLASLGLRTIGQVVQFPANELMERFGREGWLISRLARGEDPDFFVPETPPDDWQEEIYLGFAIYSVGQINNYLRMLLEKLFGKLKVAGKSCAQITVRLRCDDRSRHTLEIAVDKPTLSPDKFLRQLNYQLAKVELPAGVVELGVGPVVTISQAIEQLALPGANCGNGGDSPILMTTQLLHPVLQYAPIPERTYQLLSQRPSVKVASSQTQTFNPPYCQRSLQGLRLIEPAQRVEVSSDRETLRVIKCRGRKQRVTSQCGPWQVSGNWWDKSFERCYYEIEAVGAATYLCYHDQEQGEWYIQGVFD